MYLAAAVLVGIGSSQRVGEDSPAFVASADVRRSIVQAEGWLTTAPKIETGDGWATRLGADVWSGPISVGAHWSHRETSQWSKDRLFVRASIQHGPLRLLGEVAPDSPQMEAKVEARLRLQHRHLVMEPRAWVGWHTTAEELGGYSWGLSMLVGFGGGKHDKPATPAWDAPPVSGGTVIENAGGVQGIIDPALGGSGGVQGVERP